MAAVLETVINFVELAWVFCSCDALRVAVVGQRLVPCLYWNSGEAVADSLDVLTIQSHCRESPLLESAVDGRHCTGRL